MSGILGGTGSNPVVAKPEIFHFSYIATSFIAVHTRIISYISLWSSKRVFDLN